MLFLLQLEVHFYGGELCINSISKVKIGGGIGILDVDQIGDTIGPSVNVGVPVHRFDNESLLVMAESSLGIFNFDPTVGTIGVSALMLYKPSAWYFLVVWDW